MFTAKCFIQSVTCVCVCVYVFVFSPSRSLVPSYVASLLFLSSGWICDAWCFIVSICVARLLTYSLDDFQHFSSKFLLRFCIVFKFSMHSCVEMRQSKALHSLFYSCSVRMRVKTIEKMPKRSIYKMINSERKKTEQIRAKKNGTKGKAGVWFCNFFFISFISIFSIEIGRLFRTPLNNFT